MDELALPIQGYGQQQPVEQPVYDLPVAQPIPVNVPRVVINTAAPIIDDTIAHESGKRLKPVDYNPFEDNRSAVQKLTGQFGERYQIWPEKIVREALSAGHDVMSEGTVAPGLRRDDITDIPAPDMPTNDSTWLGKKLGLAPVAASPADPLIEKAQAVSALAGTGGLAGTGEAGGVALGAGPSLRPALKYKDRLYKGKEGQEHMDVIPKELYPEFQKMAMSGEDISHYNFGFVNDKGQFLSREKALEYGINTGLIDPQAGKFGALTSTLMADSSKPGTAIEAMAKTAEPFFSALEHNVKSISQAKMTGDQWLGTLSNKPGVKPEEMQWTGLQDFLLENKGKPVTKAQIEEHLAGNKVELKEVGKVNKSEITDPTVKYLSESFEAPHIKTSKDIEDARKFNSHFRESTKGMSDNEVFTAIEKSNKYREAGDTKYHGYQLPGGENYREMLLTLPEKKIEPKQYTIKKEGEQFRVYPKDESSWVSQHPSEASAQKSIEASQFRDQMAASSKSNYKSSHWDEPNILAHVRMNDRTIDGKKSLHLEEIQSDWHQQGRDRGYTGNAKMSEEEITNVAKQTAESRGITWNILTDQQRQSYIRSAKRDLEKSAVPDAPFKKSWHELALKRMIREAAEKGYDRLSWTPGEAQAARYDLSKSIDTLKYSKGDKDAPTGMLVAKDKNGGVVMSQAAKPDELANIVGKEAAKKLLDTKFEQVHASGTGYHELNGADLKIGGEGMKGFYDQIIPKALEKLGKEHGVKVKESKVDTTNPKLQHGAKEHQLIYYIDIPKSLKNAAMSKGFPLFAKGIPFPLMPVEHDPFKFKPVDHDPFKDEK